MNNKVPVEHISALIDSLEYKFSHVADTTTTICLAMLPGGFRVGKGDSACVDPDNFDYEVGKHYAKNRAVQDAVNNLWMLEGYLLKTTGKLSVILPPEEDEEDEVKSFFDYVDDYPGDFLNKYEISVREA